MRLPIGLVLVLLVTSLGGAATSAGPPAPESDNWPRFRGPLAMPVSDREDLPDQWSTTENVEWAAEVPGVGWSSPIVWGSKIFLTSATSDKPMKEPSLGTDFSNDFIAELREEGLSSDEIQERLWARDREMPHEVVLGFNLFCYDLETGKLLWTRELHNGPPAGGRHRKNSFASETPVTDGERVYVYFAHLGLYAYDMEGERVWATPMKAYPTIRDYGTGASPVLHGDRLFVLDDNEEASFIAAFDKRSGEEIWRTPREVEPRRKTGWSTPFLWENELRAELVTLGPGVVISYSLEGKEIWRMNRMGGVAIQSPFAWNGRLYVTSGTSGDSNKPIVAIRPGGAGDITPSEPETSNDFVVWYNRLAGGTYLPTPVIYDGGLYVLSEKGIFARYDVDTGERLFRARVAPGASAFTASPWAYDGKIFALSEEGDTYVIKAGKEYELLGVNALEDWAMATPAIVGDRLLIRTRDRLYSIREKR